MATGAPVAPLRRRVAARPRAARITTTMAMVAAEPGAPNQRNGAGAASRIPGHPASAVRYPSVVTASAASAIRVVLNATVGVYSGTPARKVDMAR